MKTVPQHPLQQQIHCRNLEYSKNQSIKTQISLKVSHLVCICSSNPSHIKWIIPRREYQPWKMWTEIWNAFNTHLSLSTNRLAEKATDRRELTNRTETIKPEINPRNMLLWMILPRQQCLQFPGLTSQKAILFLLLTHM